MKYLLIIVFACVYIFFSNDLGYTKNSQFYTHISFMFQHAGILHLIMNGVSFFLIVKSFELRLVPWRNLLFKSMFISFGCSFIPIAQYDVPTVGFSGVIYAMLGMSIATNLKLVVTALPVVVFTVLFLFLSIFHPCSNFYMHVICITAGFVITVIKRFRW